MPELYASRCTHHRSPLASCSACLDICPRKALGFEGGRIQLDPVACDDCGLCVAACPEGALATTLSQPVHDPSHTSALLACMPAAGEPGEGILPCLHALTDQQVAALARAGVHTLVVVHLDCMECPRQPALAARLETRLGDFNSACRQRGLPGIAIKRIAMTEWKQQAAGLQATSSRRGFLGNLLKRPVAALMPSERNMAAARDAKAMGAWLRTRGEGMLPAVPVVDFSRCTLCGACAALCNHQVLSIHNLGEQSRFSVTAEQCTGCRLCADICLDHAIAIAYWQVPGDSTATFVKRSCPRCSHAFWELADTGESAECCPVCKQSGGKRPDRIVEE